MNFFAADFFSFEKSNKLLGWVQKEEKYGSHYG
jgi:hypothetical protein